MTTHRTPLFLTKAVLALGLLTPFMEDDAAADVYAEVHFSSMTNMCTVTDSEWSGDPELVMRYGAYNDFAVGPLLRFCETPDCLWYQSHLGDWGRQKIYSIGDDVSGYMCLNGPNTDDCDGDQYEIIDDSFVLPVHDLSDEIFFSMQLIDRDVWESDNLGSHLEFVHLAPAGSYTGIHPVHRWNNNNRTFNATHICGTSDALAYDGVAGNYRINAWTRVWDDTPAAGFVDYDLVEDGETLTLQFGSWDENSGVSRVGYVLGHWDYELDSFVIDVEAEIPVTAEENPWGSAFFEITFCSEDAIGYACDHPFTPIAGEAYKAIAWAENGGVIELTNVQRTNLGGTHYLPIDWGLVIPPQLDPSEMPHWLDFLPTGGAMPAEPVLIPLEHNQPYQLELDPGDGQAEPGETQELIIRVTDDFGFLTTTQNPVEIALEGRATVSSTSLIDPTGLGTGLVQGTLPPEGLARFEITHARTDDIDVQVRVKGTFEEVTTVRFGPKPPRGEDPQSLDDRTSESPGVSNGL